jgi:hypothetical protein
MEDHRHEACDLPGGVSGGRDRYRLSAVLLVLAAVNVAAVLASPLVAEFALHHGEPGWAGWLCPAMTSGLALGSGLLIAADSLTGRRGPLWAWLILAAALAFTGWAAISQAVTR